MMIDAIRSDPEWNGGDYTKPPHGLELGYDILRMLIDSAPNLQLAIPNQVAADRFLASNRVAAQSIDANDIIYSLKSSFSYDPRPALPKKFERNCSR